MQRFLAMVTVGLVTIGTMAGCSRLSDDGVPDWKRCEEEARVDGELTTDADRSRDFEDCLTSAGWECDESTSGSRSCTKLVKAGETPDENEYEEVQNPFGT